MAEISALGAEGERIQEGDAVAVDQGEELAAGAELEIGMQAALFLLFVAPDDQPGAGGQLRSC